jgi:hypothetical protein
MIDALDDEWVVVDEPDDDWRVLTPLGPGGRPLARWRPITALLAVVALFAVGAMMLSDRAPGLLSDASERVIVRIDDRVPEARARLYHAVAGTAAEERDVQAHVALWAGATLLLGLTSWSWRSLAGVTALVLGASAGLELVQERLAPSRITEQSDLVANTAGVLLGLVLVVVITGIIGVPSLIRERRAR